MTCNGIPDNMHPVFIDKLPSGAIQRSDPLQFESASGVDEEHAAEDIINTRPVADRWMITRFDLEDEGEAISNSIANGECAMISDGSFKDKRAYSRKR